MRRGVKRVMVLMLAAVLVVGMMPVDVLATEIMSEIKEVAVSTTEANMVEGTLGSNNGISYSYDTSTKTLTVTGEDSGMNGTYISEVGDASLFYDICSDVEKIILQDCCIIGDASWLFARLDKLQSIEMDNFDTSQVTDMSYMFRQCSSLTSLDLSGIDTSQVSDMSYMFYDCAGLTSLDLSGIDTSQVTDMTAMFCLCSSLTNVDVSSFDTSQVTDMQLMFRQCSSLTELDLGNFDTSQVTNMKQMFYYCTNLMSLDLRDIDTSQVADMQLMFCLCSSLTELDLSSFDTSQVWTMASMFSGCSNLTELNLSNFDTSQVQVMIKMFHECSSLTAVNVSNFDTSQVTIMADMFSECSSLTELNLSSFDTSQVTIMYDMFTGCSKLAYIDTPKCMPEGQSIELPATFYDEEGNSTKALTLEFCNKLLTLEWCEPERTISIVAGSAEVEIGDNLQLYLSINGEEQELGANSDFTWAVASEEIATVSETGLVTGVDEGAVTVTCVNKENNDETASVEITVLGYISGTLGDNNGIRYRYDIAAKTLTVTGEDSGVNGTYISGSGYVSLFHDICGGVEHIILRDCTIIGNAELLFAGLGNLRSIEMNNFDTAQITNMRFMFLGCSSLIELDLGSFDTSQVTDMKGTFDWCSSLTNVDVSGFDTSKVTDMSQMFRECSSLTAVNVSNFDTSQVTNMYAMFSECYSLTELDVSNFDTSRVTSMQAMFSLCDGLTELDVSNFNTSLVADMRNMFGGCERLTELDLSSFDTSQVTTMADMFYLCRNLTELNLSGFDTSQVTSMFDMFTGCSKLAYIDTPKCMPEGQSLQLPATFYDEEGNSTRALTLEFCNKLLTLEWCEPERTISIVADAAEVAIGESLQLYLSIDGEKQELSTNDDFTWMVASEEIATVSKTGLVIGVSEGITIVTCVNKEDTNETAKLVLRVVTGTLGENGGFSYIYDENTKTLTVIGEDSGLDLSEVEAELVTLILSDCVIRGEVNGLLEGCNNLVEIHTPKQLPEGQSIVLPGKFLDANGNITEEITSEFLDEVLKRAVKIELEYFYINTEGYNSRYQDIQYAPEGTLWGEFLGDYEKCFDSGEITNADETITVWEHWIQNILYDSEDEYYENTIGNFNQYTDCAQVRFVGIPSDYKHGFVAFRYIVYGELVDSGTGWDMLLPTEYAYGSDEAIAYVTENLNVHEHIYNYCTSPDAVVTVTAPWEPTNEGQWEGYLVDIQVDSPQAKLKRFVERMYTVALGREAEAGGVSYWVSLLQSGRNDGEDIARGFFGSEEFIGKNLSNEEYLEVLYATFFDREPDAGGWEYNMGLLGDGADRNDVLAVFINSDEFSKLCESFGIEAVYTQEELVAGFVERMYTVALNRAAEEDGVAHWVGLLLGGDSDGEDIAMGFFTSEEFVGRNLSNEDYLEVLYATFFDREADEEGWAHNMSLLENGVSRDDVLAGFIYSTEFDTLCTSYGMEAVYTQEEMVRNFVERMYTAALGRDAEEEGAAYWTAQLLAGNTTGVAVADSFISGEEFVNRSLSDREYVEVLYATFFDREGTESDIEYWMNVAASDRRTVLIGFAGSDEFKERCAKAGIIVGTIS